MGLLCPSHTLSDGAASHLDLIEICLEAALHHHSLGHRRQRNCPSSLRNRVLHGARVRNGDTDRAEDHVGCLHGLRDGARGLGRIRGTLIDERDDRLRSSLQRGAQTPDGLGIRLMNPRTSAASQSRTAHTASQSGGERDPGSALGGISAAGMRSRILRSLNSESERTTLPSSFRDAPLGAGPESITPTGGYGACAKWRAPEWRPVCASRGRFTCTCQPSPRSISPSSP